MKRLMFAFSLASLTAFCGAAIAFAQGLTGEQAAAIFAGCQEAATEIPSAVRTGAGSCSGKPCVKQWCAVVDREGTLLLIKATDTGGTPQNPAGSDAWRGSIEIAVAKAYTAVAFSSSQEALTSRTVGLLTRPDGPGSTVSTDIGTDVGVAPLWGLGNTNPFRTLNGGPGDDSVGLRHRGIVTFAGGVPVYQCGSRTLLGAVGSSGDGVDEDERVASDAIEDANFCCQPNKTTSSRGCPPVPTED
jgi:uncharacterized protein GlcG (DUF336 family)